MIAIADPTDAQIRREFEEMLPELVSRFRCRFLSNGSDLQDEHTAEAIAFSWQTYQSARRRGREPSASNLAWYSSRCVLSGRRLAGATSLDAMSTTRVARERIGAHVGLSEIGENAKNFYLVFGDRRSRWPIVDIVGTRLDWHDFICEFDRRDQRIIELKLDGQSQVEIADELTVSPAFVCQRLRAIRRRWDNMQAAA